jgi:hypothetical protein
MASVLSEKDISKPIPARSSAIVTLIWICGLTLLYAALVLTEARRPMWYDELFTFHLATAPTVKSMLDLSFHYDLNPPLSLFLTRLSIALFGQSDLATRLPSILAFYLGSIMIAWYVSRKVGRAYAILALAVIWGSPMFRYASEARPYALLFAGFASMLLCWDIAVTAERRTAALWGMAIASCGMIATHVFAPLSLAPFFAAEAVRLWRTRKPDYRLWLAMGLPALGMAAYIPLIRMYRSVVMVPAPFQASPRRTAAFFYHTIEPRGWVLFVAILAALAIPVRAARIYARKSSIHEWDLAILATLLLNPIVLNLVMMRQHGVFWDRYCITTAIAVYAALCMFLGWRFHFSQRQGVIAAVVLFAILLPQNVILPLRAQPPAKNASVLSKIRPDLPLVAASGLTFFEMDHYENPSLVSRLYYLKDRPSAVAYAHATLFEDFEPFDVLKKSFPIHGNVEPYADFVKRHRQFLVLGTKEYPEDWLLRKLEHDGAEVVQQGSYAIPYKDSNVYLVTLEANSQ